MGIGFVLAVKADDADAILKLFNNNAYKYAKEGIPEMKAYKIGYVAYAKEEVKTQKDNLVFED